MPGRFYSFWKDLSGLQFALSSGLDAKIKEPERNPGASQGRRDGREHKSSGVWKRPCGGWIPGLRGTQEITGEEQNLGQELKR